MITRKNPIGQEYLSTYESSKNNRDLLNGWTIAIYKNIG